MKTFLFIFFLVLLGCNSKQKKTEVVSVKEVDTIIEPAESNKIKVLNFATFHMGNTTDANSVAFDETNRKNQEDAKKIAALISVFKPTVICVEVSPKYQTELNEQYQKFLESPDTPSRYYGEVGLVAFQVGKMNGIDTLYAIDHKMSYNYNIGQELAVNTIDSLTYQSFVKDPFKTIPHLDITEENLSLLEKLQRMNDPKFLDFLITINADILTYVGTEGAFEGADEAAKYYQRNLRIYSNLNRLPLQQTDRVFILSGGSHTAFLNDFLKRSLKYEVVNTLDYLQ